MSGNTNFFIAHCTICNDIKHFNSKVNDAKRIANNIKSILLKYGSIHTLEMYEGEHMRHNFDFDHQHQHFMCGECMKANKQSLVNAELEIVDHLLRFVMLVKKDKSAINTMDYHDILRNLQGYYPGMYRALEREWNKNE